LADIEAEEGKRAENQSAAAKGKVTFGDALETFQKRSESQPNLKPKTKSYWSVRFHAAKNLPKAGVVGSPHLSVARR